LNSFGQNFRPNISQNCVFKNYFRSKIRKSSGRKSFIKSTPEVKHKNVLEVGHYVHTYLFRYRFSWAKLNLPMNHSIHSRPPTRKHEKYMYMNMNTVAIKMSKPQLINCKPKVTTTFETFKLNRLTGK
jgi:hypothetical protein